MGQIVSIAREHGVKSYLTVNTVIYDEEIETLHATIDRACEVGVDAIIATDMAAIQYARSVGMAVHISTQSNISNIEAVRFFAQWADVVVLARELDLVQVAYISREIERQRITGPGGELVRIEMFAHGALCMAISGKCYLSLHTSDGFSANRGACRQICRRKYLVTDPETGETLDVEGNYILSPKDLCTIDFLDYFIESGVRVLKIEGRARGAEYVKRVVECYDRALRAMEDGDYTPELAAALKERLATVFNRGFWEGYYAGRPIVEHSRHHGSAATKRKVYVGKVTNFFKKYRWPRCSSKRLPYTKGTNCSGWAKRPEWSNSTGTKSSWTSTPCKQYSRERPARSKPSNSSAGATSSTNWSIRSDKKQGTGL